MQVKRDTARRGRTWPDANDGVTLELTVGVMVRRILCVFMRMSGGEHPDRQLARMAEDRQEDENEDGCRGKPRSHGSYTSPSAILLSTNASIVRSATASRAGTAVRLATVAVPAYFFEEMAQMPAYVTGARPFMTLTAMCAVAAVGDALVLLVVWAAITAVLKIPTWFSPPRMGSYTIAIASAVVINATAEWLATRLGLWGYQSWHPLVPVIGIGVVPVAQPMVVVPLVLWLSHRWLAVSR